MLLFFLLSLFLTPIKNYPIEKTDWDHLTNKFYEQRRNYIEKQQELNRQIERGQQKRLGFLYTHGYANYCDLFPTLALQFQSAHEQLDTIEWSYRLLPEKSEQMILSLGFGGNLTLRTSPLYKDPILEETLYLILRLHLFPWSRFVYNTFAVGEGISHVTRIPHHEASFPTHWPTKALLNYLLFELTWSPAAHRNIEFVFPRVHHRSPAYGLYGTKMVGSNALGFGIRFYV